jgi:hypothetical protein
MITDLDWQDVIAKCQAVNKPNETAYLLLAAATYMTEHDVKLSPPQYSGYSSTPSVEYDSGSEFSEAAKGKEILGIMEVMDELMEALQLIAPRMYAATIDKIRAVP